jgi:hypothetical protein
MRFSLRVSPLDLCSSASSEGLAATISCPLTELDPNIKNKILSGLPVVLCIVSHDRNVKTLRIRGATNQWVIAELLGHDLGQWRSFMEAKWAVAPLPPSPPPPSSGKNTHFL